MNDYRRKSYLRHGNRIQSPTESDVCFYCMQPIDEMTRTTDHVVPKSRGGIRSNNNKVFCCVTCNQMKSNMTPDEWKEALYMMIREMNRKHSIEVNHYKKIINNINKMEDVRRQQGVHKK